VDIFALSIGVGDQLFSVSDQMRLGHADDNDLILPDQKVSLHHALIHRQGYVYKITDLNSDCGTYVNGKRITGPTLLKSGDIVLVGDTQLTISDQP
jgi:pSer/pThr/pTyr-binding forkhead associated (FHA) protein